jgi:hypothetical protein
MFKNKYIIYFLVAFAVLILVAATNPSKEAHQKKVQRVYEDVNPITGNLGGGFVFSKLLEYHDYGLFSCTNISNEDKQISVGFLGYVYVTDLDIALEK